MKNIITLAILSLTAVFGQQAALSFSCTPTTIKPPASATCQITQSGGNTTASGPTTYQITLSASGFTLSTTTVTVNIPSADGFFSQLSGPSFMLDWMNSSNPITPTLVAGTGIPDGIIATVVIPVPAGTTCPGNSACLVFSASASAATLAGGNFPVTVTPSAPVSISNFCDVTGDGQVNISDVAAELALIFAKNIAGDRNGDGLVNAVDFQIVELAALGKGCIASK